MSFWLYALVLVVVMVALMKISTTAKYHIKYIGFGLYCIFLTCLVGIFCIFKPGSSKNVIIAKIVSKLILFEWMFGIDIQIEDWDKLKNAKKPFVVVSNHQTALDAFILLKACPNGTAPLAKKVLLYVPIFGPVCWLCGTIFIDRAKGKSAIEIMRKVGCEMKQKITSLWIFPEGTRYQLDEVKAFKKGAFHLAIQAKVPVIPVVFCNYRNVIDRKNRLFEGGQIRVKCLDPIDTNGMTSDDVDELTERVRGIVCDTFNKDMEENSEIYQQLPSLKVN